MMEPCSIAVECSTTSLLATTLVALVGLVLLIDGIGVIRSEHERALDAQRVPGRRRQMPAGVLAVVLGAVLAILMVGGLILARVHRERTGSIHPGAVRTPDG
jgi:hypothetical protein